MTLNSIGDSVITIDVNGFIKFMNPVAERLTGWSESKAENIKLTEVFRIVNAQTRESVRSPVSKVLESGNIEWLAKNTLLISNDGTECQIADSASPIRDKEENIGGVVLVFRDVSEYYRMDKALEISDEKLKVSNEELREKNETLEKQKDKLELYKKMVEGSDDMIVAVDKDYKYISVNSSFLKYHKLNEEEVIGHKVSEISGEKDFQEEIKPNIDQCLKGETVQFDMVRDYPEFGRVNVDVQYYPLEKGESISGVVAVIRDITWHKKIENALKTESQARRILLDNIPTQVWYLTDERTYGAVNKAHADFSGVSIEELSFKSLYEIYPKEIAETCIKGNRKVFSTGNPLNTQEWVPNASGEKRLLSIVKSPKLDDEGMVEYVVCAAEDITESRRMEKAVEESEAKYRSLIENSNDAIYLLYNHKFEIINDKFERMFGYTLKEVNESDFDFIQLVAPKSQPIIEDRLERFRKGENLENRYEFTAISKDGRELEIEASVTHFPYKDGEATLGIIRDVTERKKAEEQVKYYSELQQVLMDMSTRYINIPLQDVDKAINSALWEIGEFVEADRAYVFDYDFQRQITKNTYEWCREGIGPQINELQVVPLSELPYWVDAHVKGEPMYVPDVFALPDNGLRAFLESQDIKSLITVPMMHRGKCVGFVGFDSVRYHLNYTNREKVLLEVFAQILVNIQMRARTEKDLVKAKEKAEESDRLKSAFLANMSHEIRTPMNSILGFTNLLKESGISSEEKERYAEVIQKSGKRLLNTVNDLIEISKLESGVATVETEGINANKLVEELVNFFRDEAREKGLSLTLDGLLPEKASMLYTDQSKLESVFTNLVKNAIKYTDSGSVNVGCRAKNGFAEFFVKDTGIGVPEHRREAIFNRFEQVDVSDTRAFEGFGLGLAISESYVEMLGGEITLESEENKGSTFYFSLPLNKAEDQPQQNTSPESTKSDIPAEHEETGRKLKILVAEDDEDSFLYLKTLLRKMDCEIIQTITGTETVEQCRNNSNIDLILMDIKLPKMDGYEATRKIREFNQKVPIIAQTAYAMVGDRQKALDAGCDEYVAKPIMKDELEEKIRKFV